MAGLSMSLTLQISDPRAVRKLRGLNDPAKKRLNTQLANAMRNSTLDRFRRGEDPEGRPWAPIGGTNRATAKADDLDARRDAVKPRSKTARTKTRATSVRIARIEQRVAEVDRRRKGRDSASQQRRRATIARLRDHLAGSKRHSQRIATMRKRLASRSAALRKYARDHVPLNDTGRLRSSITTRVSVRESVVGTNVVYARIHQYGGETGRRRARFIMKARPFLGFNAEDRRVSLAIVEATLKETILP